MYTMPGVTIPDEMAQLEMAHQQEVILFYTASDYDLQNK